MSATRETLWWPPGLCEWNGRGRSLWYVPWCRVMSYQEGRRCFLPGSVVGWEQRWPEGFSKSNLKKNFFEFQYNPLPSENHWTRVDNSWRLVSCHVTQSSQERPLCVIDIIKVNWGMIAYRANIMQFCLDASAAMHFACDLLMRWHHDFFMCAALSTIRNLTDDVSSVAYVAQGCSTYLGGANCSHCVHPHLIDIWQTFNSIPHKIFNCFSFIWPTLNYWPLGISMNFRKVNFKFILVNFGWCISSETALKWISLDCAIDKSTPANMSLPEPMLTQFYVAIWRQKATMS